jgi:cell division septal protein FtsQ
MMTRLTSLLNTADKSRTKRSGASEKRTPKVRTTKVRSQATEPRKSPPVMVRGDVGSLPLPVRKNAKQKNKRRYDVALNIPGAEMRLPSLPQVAFGMRLISGVLTVALAMLLYHLWNSPAYRMEEANFEGLRRVSTQDVNALIDTSGEPVFNVDPRVLKQKLLEAFPEFTSVSVSVSLPNALDVKVEERQPLLTWRQDGRTVLVDAQGVAFPQRNEGETATPIVVEALDAPHTVDADPEKSENAQFMPVEMVTAILSMSAQAPQGTPLAYDRLHGLGWVDAKGWEAYFGDVHDMETKLRVYRALVARFEQEGIQPALISVEHVHAPYYRMER